jgi:hypothetical protein
MQQIDDQLRDDFTTLYRLATDLRESSRLLATTYNEGRPYGLESDLHVCDLTLQAYIQQHNKLTANVERLAKQQLY